MRSKCTSAPAVSTTATATRQLFFAHSASVPADTFLAASVLILAPYDWACAAPADAASASAAVNRVRVFILDMVFSWVVNWGWFSSARYNTPDANFRQTLQTVKRFQHTFSLRGIGHAPHARLQVIRQMRDAARAGYDTSHRRMTEQVFEKKLRP